MRMSNNNMFRQLEELTAENERLKEANKKYFPYKYTYGIIRTIKKGGI